MDLIQAILNRRSIRSFKPDPVPKDVLEKVIETSRWSPSGSNTQPWEFIVLGGSVMDEVKRRLDASMKPGPDGKAVPAHPEIPIISLTEKELTARAWFGIGMIAQTLCLATLEYGLGTCLMSMVTYWPEFYREMFPIPDSKVICFGVAIGYPDFDAPINQFPRTRLEPDEFTEWHGFDE